MVNRRSDMVRAREDLATIGKVTEVINSFNFCVTEHKRRPCSTYHHWPRLGNISSALQSNIKEVPAITNWTLLTHGRRCGRRATRPSPTSRQRFPLRCPSSFRRRPPPSSRQWLNVRRPHFPAFGMSGTRQMYSSTLGAGTVRHIQCMFRVVACSWYQSCRFYRLLYKIG